MSMFLKNALLVTNTLPVTLAAFGNDILTPTRTLRSPLVVMKGAKLRSDYANGGTPMPPVTANEPHQSAVSLPMWIR